MRTGSPLSGRQAMVGVAHYKSYLRCDVCCYSKINFTYTIYRLFKYNTYIYILRYITIYIYIYVHYIHIYIYIRSILYFPTWPYFILIVRIVFFSDSPVQANALLQFTMERTTAVAKNVGWSLSHWNIYIYISLLIQTLSEKVLNPPNYSKLYPKHFLRRYLDPMGIFIYIYIFIIKPSFSDEI